ncbi:protein phosphatase Slingshot homolog 2-like isoform X1 [Toxotes jaculatrix]|uniref:protein phosphatase Slingshot homolog 2-like isoform X1 n=2 Tax=Toxotes jaculatrix TaxID=941984 RepID=UPI001B3B0E53|nr:protein phosphatase Slingshot homolog 2-like isoform X1 [Toxotes jaculatrix]
MCACVCQYSMSLRDPPYEPPSVSELQEFLLADRRPTGHVNQVWPNLYIGNEVAARDKGTLHSLGITHILNAAHGPPNPGPGPCFYVNTGPRFYRDMTVDYYGVEADDAIEFILSPFFYPTARYIRAALAMGGRVFVHCLMGVSRSATLVLAFLMIAEGLRLQEAVAAVRPHRDICPNPGFLQQLRSLDRSLERERRRRQQAQTLGLSSQEEETPSLTELRQILWTNRKPVTPFNQVWQNLYIGDVSVARDKATLSSLGVTHILNAAAGRHRINTGQQFYSDLEVEYYGVEAADHPEFNLRPFFSPAAQFIDSALKKNGKVFVHCAMGVSRSGALVLAYLMICQGLSLVESIIAVRLNRDIGPNSGFLEQLRQLELSQHPQSRQITEEDHSDMS